MGALVDFTLDGAEETVGALVDLTVGALVDFTLDGAEEMVGPVGLAETVGALVDAFPPFPLT